MRHPVVGEGRATGARLVRIGGGGRPRRGGAGRRGGTGGLQGIANPKPPRAGSADYERQRGEAMQFSPAPPFVHTPQLWHSTSAHHRLRRRLLHVKYVPTVIGKFVCRTCAGDPPFACSSAGNIADKEHCSFRAFKKTKTDDQKNTKRAATPPTTCIHRRTGLGGGRGAPPNQIQYTTAQTAPSASPSRSERSGASQRLHPTGR